MSVDRSFHDVLNGLVHSRLCRYQLIENFAIKLLFARVFVELLFDLKCFWYMLGVVGGGGVCLFFLQRPLT